MKKQRGKCFVSVNGIVHILLLNKEWRKATTNLGLSSWIAVSFFVNNCKSLDRQQYTNLSFSSLCSCCLPHSNKQSVSWLSTVPSDFSACNEWTYRSRIGTKENCIYLIGRASLLWRAETSYTELWTYPVRAFQSLVAPVQTCNSITTGTCRERSIWGISFFLLFRDFKGTSLTGIHPHSWCHCSVTFFAVGDIVHVQRYQAKKFCADSRNIVFHEVGLVSEACPSSVKDPTCLVCEKEGSKIFVSVRLLLLGPVTVTGKEKGNHHMQQHSRNQIRSWKTEDMLRFKEGSWSLRLGVYYLSRTA